MNIFAKRSPHSYVIYRRQMIQLLNYPKPAWDQLCIELPCLMGFRASEVGTWRAEYIDEKHGETFVFDSKKKKLFQIPLNIQVAIDAGKVLKGRTEGYVLKNRSKAWKGRKEPITAKTVWRIWKDWAIRAGLSNWNEFSPVVGRRWFAAEWYHHQKLGLMTLSMIMRHSEPIVTLRYVQHLIFFEDLMEDFKRFQFGFAPKEEALLETAVVKR